MRIITIKLNNIGPYKGVNTFALDSTNTTNSNVILIGGKNGSGKTTLLKSIKIGLFGCFSYGFRTVNSTYLKEIENMLNNQCGENSTHFIEIAILIQENYQAHQYTIRREWRVNEEKISESLTVMHGDNVLNQYDALEFENKIKSLTSPALINSFIYDGEKISAIIERGELETYIKDTFCSVFNIGLLEQLSQDLTSYMMKADKVNNNSAEHVAIQLLNILTYVKSDIKANEEYAAQIIKDINNIDTEISSREKEFATLGGMSKEEAEKFASQVLTYEKQKEENSAFIRNVCEDALHLLILLDELRQIAKKAKAELPLQYATQLEEIQVYLKEDFSQWINLLRRKSKKTIFNLNSDEIQELNETIKELENIRIRVVNILTDKTTLANDILEIKSRLTKNAETVKLDELLQEIESLKETLTSKTEELVQIKSKIYDKNKEKDELIKKYAAISELIKKDRQSNSSNTQCLNSIQLCEIFKEKLIEKKLNQVAETACEIFNKTIRKNNYISKMQFDADFSFKLFDGRGAQMPPQLLSAGEMQILVSSLIWAMFKVSGRKEMFIFDTPLARLDVDNRIQFIKNIILTISEQVVILSTDSEFVGDNLAAIKENLAGKYLLVYDDNSRSTKITSEYFGE